MNKSLSGESRELIDVLEGEGVEMSSNVSEDILDSYRGPKGSGDEKVPPEVLLRTISEHLLLDVEIIH